MRSLVVAVVFLGAVALHAQSVSFTRGERVRVISTDPARQPTAVPLLVVAVPNDQLAIKGATLYVNDSPVMQFSADFLARVATAPERVPARVPEGHYFVMGEQRGTGDIAEYWGQHSGSRLQPVR